MNYPPFVLQLDTKNTLKLIPLDSELFSRFIVTKGTHKGTNKRLVYTKVTRPVQSRGREIVLWLQTGVLLKTGILLLKHLVGRVFTG